MEDQELTGSCSRQMYVHARGALRALARCLSIQNYYDLLAMRARAETSGPARMFT